MRFVSKSHGKETDMEKQKKTSDWMAGASICVFLPMVVHLIVLVTFLLSS